MKASYREFLGKIVEVEGCKSGAFGAYIKINNEIGLKIFYEACQDSISAVKRDHYYKMALAEHKIMRKARELVGELAPKSYGVAIINAKFGEIGRSLTPEGYFPALIVEHIEDKNPHIFKQEERDALNSQYLEAGIHHLDLFGSNMLRRPNGKLIMVDWSPPYVHIPFYWSAYEESFISERACVNS